MDERVTQAALVFEQAIFGGDAGPLAVVDRELDAAEAELAIARGKLMHARFLLLRDETPTELGCFEHAAQLYHALGDPRGEAAALFWAGCFHQVVGATTRRRSPSCSDRWNWPGRLTTRTRRPRLSGISASPLTGPVTSMRGGSGWRSQPNSAGKAATCGAWRRT